MPTKAPAKKKSPSSKSAASIRSGAVPPYGIAIRDAISRGDSKEMRMLAAATRKYLKDVQSALTKLEASINRPR